MKLVSLRLVGMIFVLGLMQFGLQTAFAQGTINHIQPTALEKGKSITLEFEVLGINVQDIQEVFLNYKYDESIVYQSLKADLERNTIRATFSVNNPNANSIQYYVTINFITDEKIYYPNNAAETNSPITVNLVDKQATDKKMSGTSGQIDFTVLSPLPDEEIVPEDALVALTLFYNEGEASADSIKIMFDGVDVTAQADVTPYLITYTPTNLKPGNHSVDIVYIYDGKKTSLTSWSFPTLDPNSAKAQQQQSGSKLAVGQVELSARNQSIFGVTDDIYKSSFRVRGSAGWFKYAINGMMTSQDNERLQPQNRYGIEVNLGDMLEVQAGHIFPSMNPLIIAGNRIFGVNAGLHLFGNLINFQAMTGEMKRSINSLYTNLVDSSIVLATNLDGSTETERRFILNYEDQGVGTYRRNVLGGRIALGNGKNFQLGFNAMKVVDRTTSLNVIENYDDILTKNPDLLANLTSSQRADLQQNPDLLQAPNGTPTPKDNFMFASDITIKTADGKFGLRSDFGLSLLNNNTSTGVLNKARADELGLDIPDNIADVLDQLSWLIIVNENMSYLPLSFVTDDQGNSKIEPLKTKFLFFEDTPVPTALLASQNSLNMTMLGQSLQFKYQWVGPEYQTLSNTAMRRDIAGYSIADRFRFFDNQIYVTLGYEKFEDNLIGSKESTTETTIMNADVSYYPISRALPRVSVGYRLQGRDNGISKTNPYFANSDLLTAALRNVDIIDGKEQVVANARLDNTNQISFSLSKELSFLGMSNDFTVNYLNLKTTDDVYAFGDFTSDVYSFGVVTNWSVLPMKTNINVTMNNSNGASGLAKVDIFGVNAGVSYFLFNDKLNIFADVAVTTNTIESYVLQVNDNGTADNLLDDYYFKKDLTNLGAGENIEDYFTTSEQNTFLVRTGATYNINQHHSLLFDASFTNVSVKTPGVVIPNDRVVQIRYVFRF